MNRILWAAFLLVTLTCRSADVRMFNTLADLAAWVPSTLSSNFTVRTFDSSRPFSSARPGHYSPTSTESTNLGCVFATSTGVGRNLMDDCDGPVDVRWFGAPADGTDGTVSIQDAFNTSHDVVFTDGNYLISSVTCTNTPLHVTASRNAVIRRTEGAGCALMLTNAVTGTWDGGVFDGYKATLTNYAVFVHCSAGPDGFTFRDVKWRYVRGFAVETQVSTSASPDGQITVENCTFIEPAEHSGVLGDVSFGVYCNAFYGGQLIVENCRFLGVLPTVTDYGAGGVFVNGPGIVAKVRNSYFDRMGVDAAGNHAAPITLYNSAGRCVIEGNTITNSLVRGLQINNTGHTLISGNTISIWPGTSTWYQNIGIFSNLRGYTNYADVGFTVENNLLYGINNIVTNGTSAILIDPGIDPPYVNIRTNVIIRGNSMWNHVNAVSIGSYPGAVITDNQIHNVYRGLFLSSTESVKLPPSQLVFQNNLIDGAHWGVHAAGDVYVLTNTSMVIDGNSFWNCTNYIAQATGTKAVIYSHNWADVGTLLLGASDTIVADGNTMEGAVTLSYIGARVNDGLGDFSSWDGLPRRVIEYGNSWQSEAVKTYGSGNNVVRIGGPQVYIADFASSTNTASQVRVRNDSDDPLAFTTFTVQSGTTTNAASGYLGAFQGLYASWPLADKVVVGVNSDAAGLAINLNNPGQGLLMQEGGAPSLYFAANTNLFRTASSAAITYDASAILELQSTAGGFLPPRMSTAQAAAIPTPAAGLMVYDTTLKSMVQYDGTRWVPWYTNDPTLYLPLTAGSGKPLSGNLYESLTATLAFMSVSAESGGDSASGYMGAFGGSYGTATLADRLALVANSDASAGLTLGVVAVTQAIEFKQGGGIGAHFGQNTNVIREADSSALTANTSAIFELQSTTKGFLPPRMTTAQKNAIVTPATGLLVWDTSLGAPYVYSGSTWIKLVGGDTTAYFDANGLNVNGLTYSATNLYEDHVFQISTLNPTGPLNGPTIVDTSGRDSQSMAAVFNTGDVCMLVDQMAHDWVPESTIYPHFHIEPQTVTALTNTIITMYSIADSGGTFPAWTKVTNTVVVAGSQQWKHVFMAMPTNGIPMAGMTGPSTAVKVRYEWTTSSDVHVISADVHYRVGGSPVAYTAP